MSWFCFRLRLLSVVSGCLLLALSCTRVNPRYCVKDDDCGPGGSCDVIAKECRQPGSGGDSGAPGRDGSAGADGAGGSGGRDGSGTQVGCGNDQDCARMDPAHPICENRMCTGCAGPAQCTAERPICGPARRCVVCMSEANCRALGDPARVACDVMTGRCVQCLASAACPADKPICAATRQCTGCAADTECRALNDPARPVCDTGSGKCVQCVVNASCTANKPICAANRQCAGCASDAECQMLNDPARAVCDAAAGRCVECLTSANCGTPSAPICDMAAKKCGKCSTDAQCAAKARDPGVCMENGRCATEAETVFVENRSPCGPSGGTPAMPVCKLADAASKLTATRLHVLVRGAVDGRLSLGSTPGRVVIVGQRGMSGDAGSIAAGAGTALQIMGGELLLRDILVTGGTDSGSPALDLLGMPSKLTMLRVQIANNAGIGVRATSGSQLTIDKTVLEKNMGGGLAVNGAAYHVSNSVFAENGFGVKFEGGVIPTSRFVSNTVVLNVGYAVGCSSGAIHTISGSIVGGFVDTCATPNSVLMVPPFDVARPYHLTARLPCPGGDPGMFPPDDIDGQPRTAPIDCGADQFSP